MKNICGILLILTTNLFCYADDISFPKSFDFGDVPVGNSSMPYIKMLNLQFINNSNEDYVIEHMIARNNYPNSIANNISLVTGYAYKYVNGPLPITANKSFNFSLAYDSYYVDSTSKSGKKLSKTLIIFYRKANEKTVIEDSILLYARSVESVGLEAFGFKYDFYFCPAGSKYLSDEYAVTLINNTSSKVRIDSVNVDIDGENLTEIGLLDDNGNSTDIVEQNSFIRYYFKFDFKKFERSLAKVKFFATTLDGKNTNFTAEDSTIVHYRPLDEEGRVVLFDRMFIMYPQDVSKRRLQVMTCAMQDYIIDSVYFKQEQNFEELSLDTSIYKFPINLSKDEINNFEILFKAASEGAREAQICVDFRKFNGETLTRCVDVSINILKNTDIRQDIEVRNPIKIFPNPANEKISFLLDNDNFNLIDNIDIYNYIGEKVYDSGSISSSLFDINTTNFNIGNYFVLIKLNDGKLIKSSIVISR
ncbi:MAG TPA: hypothetical protein PLE30_00485 [Candidatus Kapabacteria bacterium]|nr:hypothetical protein [Candidatus Kapabacteria bacterium]